MIGSVTIRHQLVDSKRLGGKARPQRLAFQSLGWAPRWSTTWLPDLGRETNTTSPPMTLPARIAWWIPGRKAQSRGRENHFRTIMATSRTNTLLTSLACLEGPGLREIEAIPNSELLAMRCHPCSTSR